MGAPMYNNNENEINQIQEESKEGMEVARDTPCNSNADSSAVRGQGENQLIARGHGRQRSVIHGV